MRRHNGVPVEPVVLGGPSAVAAVDAFTGTGTGTSAKAIGQYNIAVWGTFVGTVVLERSFDGGTTWLPVTTFGGAAISFTGAVTTQDQQPEPEVLTRLRCSAYTSGTINTRISQ